MARDLGPDPKEVHRAARELLSFWLEETAPRKRFARDPALDREIARRFVHLHQAVLRSHAAVWRADPVTLRAAVILLDQFSRNIYRDDERACAGDPLARALAREALAKGWDRGLDADERAFLYMPFMHSEAMADQLLSIALFEAEGDELSIDYAHRHAAQIARFGRFPQRNAILGRESTAAEEAFLEEPGSRF
ncbi:hypothetical protein CLG96_17735 [Sphingomonas oleivorans]|uniref:DUF924 domain-containing protein n=1 Tax=Sphingomonas oleivorans TaxID=1735121 RepID=A0A2T5FTI7_9SPHN|nr:DUF924 family protein [Sphingomonas oleivorans]PTQ07387.1 hypothetical protein CLG96_17735 [Sphingomonas oleivorans]